MGDEKVQIAFYGTRDLRRRLKRTALERGTSVQDLIEQAITRDFNAPEKETDSFTVDVSTVPPGTVVGGQWKLGLEAIHQLVDFVYSSGVESLTTALSFTLEGFAAGARLHTKNETTSSAVPQEEERTEALLRKAREASASARRSIESESGTGDGNPGGENADNPASAWRRRA